MSRATARGPFKVLAATGPLLLVVKLAWPTTRHAGFAEAGRRVAVDVGEGVLLALAVSVGVMV